MRFFFTYFKTELKTRLRARAFLGFWAFLLVLAVGMTLLLPRGDEASGMTLAVMNPADTRLGNRMIETLQQDGGYRLRLCDTRRELEALVLSGQALCGYEVVPEADQRVQAGRFTGLVSSFYREQSPAAALCDEAVCGAAYQAIAPSVAADTLPPGTLPGGEQALDARFAQRMAEGGGMEILLLGMDEQPMPTNAGGAITQILYSLYCCLGLSFGISLAFYTKSINNELVLVGQKPLMVGLCGLLAHTTGYLVLLLSAHLATSLAAPAQLFALPLLGGLGLTALLAALLEGVARRYFRPTILPLLPFATVLLVGLLAL